MDTSGVSKELGTNIVGGKGGLQVAKRQVLWANVYMPLVLVLCLVCIGFVLFDTPWDRFWRDSFCLAESEQLRLKALALLQFPFLFAFTFLLHRNWFLSRDCRCRVRFDSEQQVHCSSPEKLNELSLSEFLSAKPLISLESDIYRFDTPSGLLTVRGKFADMAAWAKWRFAPDSIQGALSRLDFPRRLQTTRQAFFISWFRYFAEVYIALNFLIFPFVFGLTTGLPGPIPRLDATGVLIALVFASCYLLLFPYREVASTRDRLELRSPFSSKTIPLDTIKEVRLWSGGFTVAYAIGKAERRAHIAQYMFSESLLPLYFVLCSHVSGTCVDVGSDSATEPPTAPNP